MDFCFLKVPMPVDDQIKGFVCKRQGPFRICFPEVHPERQKLLPAQLHIRWERFGRTGVPIRVAQGQ